MAKTLIEKEIAELIGEARSKAIIKLLTEPRPIAEAPQDGSQVLIVFRGGVVASKLVRSTARYIEGRWRIGRKISTNESFNIPDHLIVGWTPLVPHPKGILE